MSNVFCNFEKMRNMKKCLLPNVLTNFVFSLGFFRALQKLQKKNRHFLKYLFFVTYMLTNFVYS
jgi:hypothetical protein